VEDVDSVYEKALAAGVQVVQPPEDHFYGDRVAMFDDSFAHRWNIATHIEDVSPQEMDRRIAEASVPADPPPVPNEDVPVDGKRHVRSPRDSHALDRTRVAEGRQLRALRETCTNSRPYDVRCSAEDLHQ
jgi:Glyoxalase/Bleomycin resistance protein/Dioxygenase superfamily